MLGIKSTKQLATHYLYGGIFESFVIAELLKHYYNKGQKPSIYFWRDSHGHEVDCIIEEGNSLISLEIKAGQTIDSGYFAGLNYWNELAHGDRSKSFIIYGGLENQHRSLGNVISWQSIAKIFYEIKE